MAISSGAENPSRTRLPPIASTVKHILSPIMTRSPTLRVQTSIMGYSPFQGTDFNVVSQDGKVRRLHDRVLRELLGVIGLGVPPQDQPMITSQHSEVAQ